MYEFFTLIRRATHSDLILPRVAWLDCDGLPISAWNCNTWRNIIGDWGCLITECKKPLLNGMFFKLRIYIATRKVKIKETLKVLIEGKGFWVTIRESTQPNEGMQGEWGGIFLKNEVNQCRRGL